MKSSTPTYADIYSGGSHIVKFGSPACPPCVQMAPHFEKLSEDPRFKNVKFWDVDASDINNAQIISALSIRSVPVVLCVKDGTNLRILTGATSKEALESALKELT